MRFPAEFRLLVLGFVVKLHLLDAGFLVELGLVFEFGVAREVLEHQEHRS
jgi:hypothetical protein